MFACFLSRFGLGMTEVPDSLEMGPESSEAQPPVLETGRKGNAEC